MLCNEFYFSIGFLKVQAPFKLVLKRFKKKNPDWATFFFQLVFNQNVLKEEKKSK